MTAVDLAGELKAACLTVTASSLRRLNALGVSWETIAELGRAHFGFGVTNATAGDEGLYWPDPEGQPHLILPVYDRGELVDLVAFQSSAPDGWSLRCGTGWALGLEHNGGLTYHCMDIDVPLAATPLDWLRCGGRGLCVLDWSAPEVGELRDLTSVECDREIAALLRKALTTPARIPSISVRENCLAA